MGPLEQFRSHAIFEIAERAAQCRLAHVQGFGGPAKATMLSCDDRPSHISQIDIQTAAFSKGEPNSIPVQASLSSRVWHESVLGAGSDFIQWARRRA